jgi:hypothetical protein
MNPNQDMLSTRSLWKYGSTWQELISVDRGLEGVFTWIDQDNEYKSKTEDSGIYPL